MGTRKYQWLASSGWYRRDDGDKGMLMFACFLQMLRETTQNLLILLYESWWFLNAVFLRGFLTFKGRVEILKSFYPGTGSGVTPDYAVIITDPCQKELPAFYAQSLIRWEPLKWMLWNLCWSHSWVSRFLESEVFFAITIKHQIFGKAIYWGRGPTCVCKREWALCVLDSRRQNVVIKMQASCFAFSL